MSRYCTHDISPILDAADSFRKKCLINDGSVLSSDQIWDLDNIESVHKYFTENPDEGNRSFLDKLNDQLSSAEPGVKKLAAEMLWFMYLFIYKKSMKSETKREQIQRVWSWSGDELDMSQTNMTAVLELGVGNPGTAYNTRRWAEFRYFIDIVLTIKSKRKEERNELLGDPWVFSTWLDDFEEHGRPQFRHIIKFLLFPDYFERICTGKHKREIVNAFHQKNIKPRKFTFSDLDKELYEIRKEQEREFGTQDLDFYNPPLIGIWSDKENKDETVMIHRDHVVQAISEIENRGVKPDEKSSTYDLIYKAKRYPPKLVYSVAHKYAGGEDLDRSTFEGGEGTECFKKLRELGFCIERKDFVTSLLKKFINQANAEKDLKTKDYPSEYCGLTVKVSFGQGNYARVPWVCFTGYNQTVSNGIYPGYLYYKSIGVLLLTYGISDTNVPDRTWRNLENKQKIKDYLLDKYQHSPERYADSYVCKAYDLNDLNSLSSVTTDLDMLINEYDELMQDQKLTIQQASIPLAPEPIMEPRDICHSFSEALKNSHVNFGVDHKNRVSAFVASLMTKPLVILTGLSGSGKTQIAIRFGEWLGKNRMLVAPVRPDWTGAEALFGYEDALKVAINGRAAWAVPETLEFLLKASSDPNYPYLLVLDEMNLAHVERYFADVLSGMESNQPCLPNLVQGEDGFWRIKQNGPEKIALPNNVFIVGTVNVDETTYMFSPKVLDRANTFEFRVTTDDLSDSYIKPVECKPGNERLIRGFLEIGRDSNWQVKHSFNNITELSAKLRQIHSLLAIHGFEFGHRVFYESQRFAAIYETSDNVNTAQGLDRVIMQKILPRLHGSRRRLEDLIRTLAEFCFYNPDMVTSDSPITTFEPDEENTVEAKLPISFEKLKRMLQSLRANQFTSFTE